MHRQSLNSYQGKGEDSLTRSADDSSLGIGRVSIIVPVFNEEKTIGKLLTQIGNLQLSFPLAEVIVVDDGSKDRTAEIVKEFPFAKYLKHNHNRGKGAALRSGFEIARGDILAIQDADLEYSPFDIPNLAKPIMDDTLDVVFGSRFGGFCEGMSPSHYVGNRILSLVATMLFGVSITDIMTGHKCLRRNVAQSLHLKEDGFGIEIDLTAEVLRNGWRLGEIPIKYCKRSFGESKIRYLDGFRCLKKLISSSLAKPSS